MLRFDRKHLTITVVTFCVGFLLSTAFLAYQRTKTPPASRKPKLIEIIKRLEKGRNELKKKLQKIKKEEEGYEKRAQRSEGLLESYREELDALKLRAGLSKVKGPGVRITLSDSTRTPAPGVDPNNYIVHDSDLRLLVNTLWLAGAEAIAVNNQRLVSSSAIRCAGNIILINYVRLASPYRIEAIGDSEQLEKALANNSDLNRLFKEYAQSYGIGFEVEKVSSMVLPKYNGDFRLDYVEVSGQRRF